MKHSRSLKMMWLKFIILFLSIMFTTGLFAQDYTGSNPISFEIDLQADSIIYVDDDNTSGPWYGTFQNPFDSIHSGLAVADSGVTVFVMAGNYGIVQDLWVESGERLFLDTNVVCNFQTGFGLYVAGRLQAYGNSTNRIHFKSANGISNWEGIHFLNDTIGSELRYCVLEGADEAIRIKNSLVKLDHCLFQNNTGNKGGAIYCDSLSIAKISNCEFLNNQANYGGAIYCDSLSTAIIKDCQFIQNQALQDGGGIYCQHADSLLIKDCNFENNTAVNEGGAIKVDNSKLSIQYNGFSQNTANYGGGLAFNEINSGIFAWNELGSNEANIHGGGVYCNQVDSIVMSRNLFQNNHSEFGAGGYSDSSNVFMHNNTFYHNESLNQGGAIYSASGQMYIENTICWNNISSDNSQLSGTGLNVDYSLIENGYIGTGNILDNPKFLNVSINDFHLKFMSPCINTGNPTTENDADNSISDIGVYYFPHQPQEIVIHPADTIVVDTYDASFNLFASNYTNFQWFCSEDLGSNWYVVMDTSSLYSNINSSQLQINEVSLDMNGYLYRCEVFGTGPPSIISNQAELIVHPIVKTTVANVTACAGSMAVPILIDDFIGVNAISLDLLYDTTNANFDSLQILNTDLQFNYLVNENNGHILFIWFSTTVVNFESDTLFLVHFNSDGGICDLTWNLLPGACEYSLLDGTVHVTEFNNGVLTVNQPPDINSQPVSATIIEEENVSFTTGATGTSLSYQWQLSTDSAQTWLNLSNSTPYSGTTGTVLSVSNALLSMDGYHYRCLVNGVCAPNEISDYTILTVHPILLTIEVGISSVTSCAGLISLPITASNFVDVAAFSMSINYDSTKLLYQGLQNTNDSLLNQTILNNTAGSQIFITSYNTNPVTTTTDTLFEMIFISNGETSDVDWNQQTGACEFTNIEGNAIAVNYTNGGFISYGLVAHIVNHPSASTVIAGNNANFTISGTGISSYQWFESIDGGIIWDNLNNNATYSGVTVSQLSISNTSLLMDGYMYYCQVGGDCPPIDSSDIATLTVHPVPQIITSSIGSITSCADTLSIPVILSNSDNLGSFSLNLNFDNSVLTYLGIEDIHPLIDTNYIFANSVNSSFLSTWYSITPNSFGNDTLFNILFYSNGGSSDLNWNEANCEFVSIEGNSIQTNYQNGNVLSGGSVAQIIVQPTDTTVISGSSTSIFITAYYVNSYYWQASEDNGINWLNLGNTGSYSGSNTSLLQISNTDLSMDGHQYRCIVAGTCSPPDTSTIAYLNIEPVPQTITASIVSVSSCSGNISIPVSVTEFDNVGSFSMSILYCTNSFTFDSIGSLHNTLDSSLLVYNTIGNRLLITWVSVLGITLGSDTLFEINFISNYGGSCQLDWETQMPGYCEFSDINGNIILSEYNSGNISVDQNPLFVDAGVDQTINSGMSTQLSASISGGISPYSFYWETTPFLDSLNTLTPIATPLYPYPFSLIVTDANNCTVSDEIEVIVSNVPAPTIILQPINQTICEGGNVLFSVSTLGYFPLYQWYFNGNLLTGETDSALIIMSISSNDEGMYSCKVENFGSYVFSDSASLVIVPGQSISIGSDTMLCYNDTIVLNPGSSFSSYLWNDGTTENSKTVFQTGNYQISVTDINGCLSSADINVSYNPEIITNIGADTTLCYGDCIQLNPGAYTQFIWSDGSILQNLSVCSTGNYSVTVTNANNCDAIDSINVFYYQEIDIYSISIIDASCSTCIDGAIELSVIGGTSPYSYNWSNGETSEDISALDIGFYEIIVTDSNACIAIDSIEIAVISGLDVQYINLANGWILMSTYIDPVNPQVDSVFSSVIASVVLVKDGAGSVYWPYFSLNLIGDMVIGQGYQVKMNNYELLTIYGEAVVPELTPIVIPSGWSLIGYLRESPGDAIAMMASIVSEIALLKNGAGDVYWPYFNYNAIGNMNPGEGYQINMSSQQIFTYLANLVVFAKSEVSQPNLIYFEKAKNTGNNMTLGLTTSGIEFGSEIGIFNQSDLLVGSAVLENNFIAITLWGDDDTTPEIDGLIDGEEINIRIWDKETQIVSELLIESWLEGDGSYKTNKISIADKVSIIQEDSYRLYQNIPNPFTYETEFSFYLPEKARIEFTILNMLGEVVEVLISEVRDSGKHTLKYQTKNLSIGTYYYRLETEEYNETKKMVIMKR